MNPDIAGWLNRASAFRAAVHAELAVHEAATNSRVIRLEQTYQQLEKLSLKQDDLLRQALRCTELGLNRAAHVMAWAAIMDLIEEVLSQDGLAELRRVRPKWQGKDINEIAEFVPERQMVEVLRDTGLATKNQVNAMVGLLQRRNECAHPTDYLPGANETLGFISEILRRIELLIKKRATQPTA